MDDIASIEVAGTDGPIEIVRDGAGVPHCYATTTHDAFFAQGWVHAADRLWQMEYDRRKATGRWSAVVGRRGLAVDTFFRRLDFTAAVQRDMQHLAPDTLAMLDAYSAGVNAAIASQPRTREFAIAGVEPQPWEPWHCLLVARVRHVLMGSARSKLWRAVVAGALDEDVARTMVPGWSEEHIACVPPGEPCALGGSGLGDFAGGSNNWVLAGARTASGRPLLAGDPHREIESPSVYVQGHIAGPEWDVLGIGMPGVPGFSHFGHTQRVAWSITHAMADDQDLYEFSAGAHPVTRTETITVRDGDPVEVDITVTPRGPLITDTLALAWTATEAVNTGFDALPAMLRAGSVDELFEAMRPWVEPANSLLAADVDGHIGYLTRGRLPARRRMEAVWVPVPGDDESYGWDGWVPFADLPRMHDPAGGFLFSANNQIAADPDAPYIGIDVAAPGRARRILETLEATTAGTVDDMAALHRDVVSLPARRLVKLLDWKPLHGWDGAMEADSTAAAAYSVFRRELMLLVLERSGLTTVLDGSTNRALPGVVPESAFWRTVGHHLEAGDESLLGGDTWAATIAEAIRRAEAAWSGETWGDLHRTHAPHALGQPELNAPSAPFPGDFDTVMAAAYVPTVGLAMRHGSVARYAFDVADWDNSGWIVPFGADGEPGAPHAADQLEHWAAGRLLPAPYTRGAVDAAATARTVLHPN